MTRGQLGVVAVELGKINARWVNDQAIAEAQGGMGSEGNCSVARKVMGEIALAERIGRKPSIAAAVPLNGMAQIVGMIKHTNARSTAVKDARTSHPIGALPPDGGFTDAAI